MNANTHTRNLRILRVHKKDLPLYIPQSKKLQKEHPEKVVENGTIKVNERPEITNWGRIF